MIDTKVYRVSFLVANPSGDKIDLATPEHMANLELSEFAGGLVPIVKATFLFKEKEYLRTLNEGNVCLIRISSDESQYAVDYYCRVMRVQIDYDGNNTIQVKATFCGDYLYFTSNANKRIYKNTSSLGVVANIARLNELKVLTDIQKTPDVQNWVQSNCTDYSFLSNVIKHIDLGDNFPLFALTLSREILLYSSDYVVNSTPVPIGDVGGAYPYLSVSEIFQETYELNRAAGYGLFATEAVAGTDTVNTIEELPNTKLYLTSDRLPNADPYTLPKRVGVRIKTENHHENFHKSALKTVVNSSITSAFRVKVVIKNAPQIKIFTKVRLFVPDLVKPKELNKQLSGDYIVLSKTLKLTGQELLVELVLGRQSINYK